LYLVFCRLGQSIEPTRAPRSRELVT